MVARDNRRLFSQLIVFGVFMSLCCTLLCIPTVDAVLVWSETFGAGTLPPEWTVLEGTFSCTNNRLETGTGVWHAAYRASTVDEGEWRFDAHYETVAGMFIWFMAQDTTGVGAGRPNNGYGIQVSRFDNMIRLLRHVSGVESYMGYQAMTASNDYSFIVTRDSSGEFNVWIDGVHAISATHTGLTTSAYFLVVVVDPGNYVDNIYVYDEIETTTTGTGNGGTTTPVIPGFPAIAIAVGIVSALTIGMLSRRRKSPTQPK
jgi:hypothetical protein